jgi:hypothetical protein
MRRCAVTTSTYAKPAAAVRKFDVADEPVLERGEGDLGDVAGRSHVLGVGFQPGDQEHQ